MAQSQLLYPSFHHSSSSTSTCTITHIHRHLYTLSSTLISILSAIYMPFQQPPPSDICPFSNPHSQIYALSATPTVRYMPFQQPSQSDICPFSNPHRQIYAPQGNPTVNPHTAYACCIVLLQPLQPLCHHSTHAMMHHTYIHTSTPSINHSHMHQWLQQATKAAISASCSTFQQLYLTCTITHTYNSPHHHIQHAKLYRSHHSPHAYQQPSLFHICPSEQPYH
jgi:hypothetical protein